MVINDLDITGMAAAPDKAHAPLVIDPDRVLSPSIALQSLQPIGRW